MDFDDILPYIGGFGRFQLYAYFLLCGPMFFSAIAWLVKIFLVAVPDHWCRLDVGQLNGWNLTLKEIKNFTIPLEEKNGAVRHSQCSMYDVNFTEILENGGFPVSNSSWNTVPCKYGWTYDTRYYESTVTTEVRVL